MPNKEKRTTSSLSCMAEITGKITHLPFLLPVSPAVHLNWLPVPNTQGMAAVSLMYGRWPGNTGKTDTHLFYYLFLLSYNLISSLYPVKDK